MIQSVRRAAAILRELGSGHPRLGVTELSERLSLAKATVYGLLRSLEADALVERDHETGKYRLGPALLQMGNAYLEAELRAIAPVGGLLATRTLEGGPGSRAQRPKHADRPPRVPARQLGADARGRGGDPWHASALGKAVAAFRDEAALQELLSGGQPLAQLTGRTIVEPDELREVLEGVRRNGVAVEDQEAVLGEAEVAAPVLDHDGHPIGAIGVAGPVEHLIPAGRARDDVIAAVKQSARGLSRDLGGVRRYAKSR
jgi:DNA-binding IclR family transcriptional regulator